MKNPLRKRLPRELKKELGKYIVIFLFMTATIGFISGFLVADNSLIAAYDESFEKYNIEDGNFEITDKASDELIKMLEKEKLTIYENFYVEKYTEAGENESVLRIFANREQVDKVCLMEGTFPAGNNEIAIDRMYADNNKISAGDNIIVDGRNMKVTGLVALSDYSALFSDNSDIMFDSIKFGVAVVDKECFESLADEDVHYNYAWIYDKSPADDKEAKHMGEDFLKVLNAEAQIIKYIPRYTNQAIKFTGDDMGGDKAIMIVLLYVLIVILAFVFAVTIGNTIIMESKVIGTLRASGYTKGELLRHYMSLPVIVTFAAAIVGNILGYTIFKDICAGMYYGSYSLPTYETRWNAEAFLLTTIVPIILMFAVNLCMLSNKLSLSPLKFLHNDLNKKNKKKAVKLPELKFFSRFRLRIIMQNSTAYITIFIGVIFANILLIFGLSLPSMLEHYQNEVEQSMIAKYQYILKVSADTQTSGAEKYAAYSLETAEDGDNKSDISVYGIEKDSSYISIDFKAEKDAADGEILVYISDGIAEKYSLKKGDKIKLKECYSDDVYEFVIAGIYYYPAALSIFMDIEDYRIIFDKAEGYFNGYFSNEEITDINEAYIASVITQDDLTKLSRQLDKSMGNMMDMVNVFAVVLFLIIIYLISKIVIEKNASSISMVKILGFNNGEIGKLYILSNTIAVFASIIVSLPVVYYILKFLFYYMIMTKMSGWFSFYVETAVYVKMAAAGILGYTVAAVLQYRRIKKVPMSEALKNAE